MNILSWLKNLFNRKREVEADKPTSFVAPETLAGGISELPITKTATADIFVELKNLKDELTELKTKTYSALGEINKQKKEVKETFDIAKDTRSLVVFGFFALLIVVIGIAYGYWQFIYTASRNDDYRYKVSEKIFQNSSDISEVKNGLKELKNCLRLGGWNYCLSQ